MRDESLEDYQARFTETEKLYRQEVRALSEELLGKASALLAGKRLIIVPDGKLHYFPFAALPIPFSDAESPLLLEHEIVYEPSASTLLLRNKDNSFSQTPDKGLIIFSDPVFSADDVFLIPLHH
jgi:hypothetical protein